MEAVIVALTEFENVNLNNLGKNIEGILWDMDGVLADVSRSYRSAIVMTAAHFGVTLTGEDITLAKSKGNANNDWILTHRLIAEKKTGVNPTDLPSLEAVTDKFEELYQGVEGVPGLWQTETLLADPVLLQELSKKFSFGIVTGRPRHDALRFLEHFKITSLFKTIVCMEDAALKPDPAPVQLALKNLGIKKAIMIGDTPDDLRAATGANVHGIGILSPQERGNIKAESSLWLAGALKLIGNLEDLRAFL